MNTIHYGFTIVNNGIHNVHPPPQLHSSDAAQWCQQPDSTPEAEKLRVFKMTFVAPLQPIPFTLQTHWVLRGRNKHEERILLLWFTGDLYMPPLSEGWGAGKYQI